MADGSEPLASAGYHLWQSSLAWSSAMAEALQPLGLTHVQFFVLRAVRALTQREARAPSQAHIADFGNLDRMMTSKVVRRRRLLVRSADPADARVRQVHLTPQGAELLAQATALAHQVEAAFFAAIGAGLSQFVHQLSGLTPAAATPLG